MSDSLVTKDLSLEFNVHLVLVSSKCRCIPKLIGFGDTNIHPNTQWLGVSHETLDSAIYNTYMCIYIYTIAGKLSNAQQFDKKSFSKRERCRSVDSENHEIHDFHDWTDVVHTGLSNFHLAGLGKP